MTPVYKLSANSVKNGRTVYGSMLAGNPALQLPGDFESIATASVTSNTSTVTFSNIPQTFTHLQLRYMSKQSAGTAYFVRAQYNGNTTAANYSYHIVNATGSAVTVGAGASEGYNYYPRQASLSNSFGVGIVDILDYTNTNKNTTIKGLGGGDDNGSGNIDFLSGGFYQTTAITSIDLTMAAGQFAPYSHFALYGIKSA